MQKCVMHGCKLQPLPYIIDTFLSIGSIESINTGIDTSGSKIVHFFQPPSMVLILHEVNFLRNLFHCTCLAQ